MPIAVIVRAALRLLGLRKDVVAGAFRDREWPAIARIRPMTITTPAMNK
jgi:hypothetical protein